MPYVITGTLTFASQAHRDAARTRIDAALPSLGLTPRATTFTAGISQPTTTTLNVSMEAGMDGLDAGAAATTLYNAAVQSNRHTSGYLSINFIP